MKEDDFLEELAATLFAHSGNAQVVGFDPRNSKSFTALPHECHGNVDRWAAAHPESEVVRGWLVYAYTLSAFPMVRFQAHSVLEEKGQLVDITPSDAGRRPPFIRHPDGNEMFDLMLSKRGIVSLTHKLCPGA